MRVAAAAMGTSRRCLRLHLQAVYILWMFCYREHTTVHGVARAVVDNALETTLVEA